VGTTPPFLPGPPWPSVHPHGRGDNKMAKMKAGSLFGSPPRAWGQLIGQIQVHLRNRFTPTGVGTTW